MYIKQSQNVAFFVYEFDLYLSTCNIIYVF